VGLLDAIEAAVGAANDAAGSAWDAAVVNPVSSAASTLNRVWAPTVGSLGTEDAPRTSLLAVMMAQAQQDHQARGVTRPVYSPEFQAMLDGWQAQEAPGPLLDQIQPAYEAGEIGFSQVMQAYPRLMPDSNIEFDARVWAEQNRNQPSQAQIEEQTAAVNADFEALLDEHDRRRLRSYRPPTGLDESGDPDATRRWTPEEREAQGTETIRKIGGALGRAALGVGKGLLGGARAIR
jgi:hypothetical protein